MNPLSVDERKRRLTVLHDQLVSGGAPETPHDDQLLAAQYHLLIAMRAMADGSTNLALARTLEALELAFDDPSTVLLGTRLLFAQRRFSIALRWLDRLAETASDAPVRIRALDTAFGFCARLGWAREGAAYAARADALDGARRQRLELRARMCHGADDEAGWLRCLKELDAQRPSLRSKLVLAEAYVAACEFDTALALLRPLLARTRESAALALDVAQILCKAGDVETAHRCVSAHLDRGGESDPSTERHDEVLAFCARFALFRLETRRATRLAERLCALDSALSAVGFMVLGALECHRGAFAEALLLLDRSLGIQSSAEALAWKSEALSRSGAHSEGEATAQRAALMTEDGTDSVVPNVLADLSWRLRGRREPHSDRVRMALGFAREHRLADLGDGAPTLSTIEQLLRAMGGNRSLTPTVLAMDAAGKPRLQGIVLQRGPRHRSKRALFGLGHAPRADVELALEDLHERFPSVGLTHNYHGEALLFLGEFEAARAQFQQALTKTKQRLFWAHVGMAAVSLLHDRAPEDALRWLDRGVEEMGYIGTTYYGYRGEAFEALGRWAEAAETLERGVSISPHRVGAWIALSLVSFEQGNVARATECVQHLRHHAAALFSDAEDQVGILLERELGSESRERMTTVLLEARRMLRGNRASSLLTYHTQSGLLRIISPRPPVEEAMIVEELSRVTAFLVGVPGARPQSRAV